MEAELNPGLADCEACVQPCTKTLMAVVLKMAKNWKQPVRPLFRKWINKVWEIHEMKYYSSQRE